MYKDMNEFHINENTKGRKRQKKELCMCVNGRKRSIIVENTGFYDFEYKYIKD